MKNLKLVTILVALLLVIVSCNNDDDEKTSSFCIETDGQTPQGIISPNELINYLNNFQSTQQPALNGAIGGSAYNTVTFNYNDLKRFLHLIEEQSTPQERDNMGFRVHLGSKDDGNGINRITVIFSTSDGINGATSSNRAIMNLGSSTKREGLN